MERALGLVRWWIYFASYASFSMGMHCFKKTHCIQIYECAEREATLFSTVYPTVMTSELHRSPFLDTVCLPIFKIVKNKNRTSLADRCTDVSGETVCLAKWSSPAICSVFTQMGLNSDIFCQSYPSFICLQLSRKQKNGFLWMFFRLTSQILSWF